MPKFIHRSSEKTGSVQRVQSQIDLSMLSKMDYTYKSGEATVISPFFFLNYIIKEALKDNNFHITTNFLNENPQLRNLCIYNNYDITQTVYLQTGEIIYQKQVLGFGELGAVISWANQSAGYKLYSYRRNYFSMYLDENHIPHPGNWITPKNHLQK